MADVEKVSTRATRINAGGFPAGSSPAFIDNIINTSGDVQKVADKVNETVTQGNDTATRVTVVEGDIVTLQSQVQTLQFNVAALTTQVNTNTANIATNTANISTLQGQVATLQTNVTTLQGQVSTIQGQIVDLDYRTTRKKTELLFSGISLVIPTTPTNLITILKALTPTSGTFAPFFNTTSDKLFAFSEAKNLQFKLSIIGSYPGGTTNRSMQLTFNVATPDTLVVSRDSVTTTDNVLFNTFFSVDVGDFLAVNGATMIIQANGAAFTATTIKLIATQ
ncbi:MAG: hypothetical protein [Bacteriophage sp.]|nr:MAG: hypothetical protein [Bacteriophage sp.]